MPWMASGTGLSIQDLHAHREIDIVLTVDGHKSTSPCSPPIVAVTFARELWARMPVPNSSKNVWESWQRRQNRALLDFLSSWQSAFRGKDHSTVPEGISSRL